MQYRKYRFTLSPSVVTPLEPSVYLALLAQSLADIGFETFDEEESSKVLTAYLPERSFAHIATEGNWQVPFVESLLFSFTSEPCAEENWNARWEEESFAPLTLGHDLLIKAPHHQVEGDYTYTLLLEPRCAFGSGAHATTRMLLRMLWGLREQLSQCDCLDVGCGTGVLALTALLLGAREATLIDIDPTSVANTLHNAQLNALESRGIYREGTLEEQELAPASYKILFANLHKNIIAADAARYAQLLEPGGYLLISGFFYEEVSDMITLFAPYAMEVLQSQQEGEWAAMLLRRSCDKCQQL